MFLKVLDESHEITEEVVKVVVEADGDVHGMEVRGGSKFKLY